MGGNADKPQRAHLYSYSKVKGHCLCLGTKLYSYFNFQLSYKHKSVNYLVPCANNANPCTAISCRTALQRSEFWSPSGEAGCIVNSGCLQGKLFSEHLCVRKNKKQERNHRETDNKASGILKTQTAMKHIFPTFT